MHQSGDGTLWVVTSGGLARMRHNRFERVNTVSPEKPESLFGLDSDQQGRLYLGSTQGLQSGEPSPAGEVRFQFVEGVPRVPVKGVYVEPTGGLWFGCGSNLCHLADGRTEVLGPRDGLPEESWRAILRDRQGQLWVRGLQRLYVRPAGAARFIANDAGLAQSSNVGVDLAMDHDGTIMVSTDLGLARWVKGKWTLVGTAQGLESETVSSGLQDREGSIWIGLWGAGIARWLGYEEWTNWTKADGLGNNIVWTIRRLRAGAIFAGTDNGLVRIDESGKAPPVKWTAKNGLAGDKVKALAASADGALWIGVLPGGISRLDAVTGRIRNYGAESGLADLHVIALYVDSANRLWVTTSGGLFRSSPLDGPLYAKVRFERQTPPMAEGNELYFRLIGDRSGRIWIGGMHGLFCWDRGHWTRFTTADGLQSNSVTHLSANRRRRPLDRISGTDGTFPVDLRRW
jgi:Predicted periplasmic ligand-binding sensor domain